MNPHPPEMNKGDALLIDGFRLHWRVSRQSPSTITNYVHSLRRVSLWLSTQDVDLRTATKFHLMTFLAERYEKVSPRTGQTDYKALRAFYKWAAEQEGMANPVATVRGPKINADEYERPASTADRDDYKALVATCRPTAGMGRIARAMAVRDAAILSLMWWLGPRPVEVANIRSEDVDLAEGLIGIRKSKNGKPRMQRIPHQDLLMALDRWERTRHALNLAPGEDAFFVGLGRNGKKGRGGMLANGITTMFRRRRTEAGLPDIEPYAFRRGRASEYIAVELKDAQINHLMGWAPNSRMSARYARANAQRLAGDAAVEIFSEGTVTRLRDLD